MSTYNRVVAADSSASLAPTVRERLATELADSASEIGGAALDTYIPRSEAPISAHDPLYGATGDGATDDTAALNAWATAVAGKTALLPPGTYLTSTGVSLGASTTLHAYGAALKGTSGTSHTLTVTTGCQVFGLEVNGNKSVKTGGSCVYAATASNIILRDLYLHDAFTKGINFASVTDYQIHGCRIADCTSQGIDLVTSDRGRIEGNTINDCAHGIQWWGGDAAVSSTIGFQYITISGNVIRNVVGGGIWGSLGQFISVTGNVIDTCADVGIDFEGCKDSTATGNTVRNCTNAGLSVFYGSSHVVFEGNSVRQETTAMGAGFKAFTGTTNTHISVIGNDFYSASTNKEAVSTDDQGLSESLISSNNIVTTGFRAVRLLQCHSISVMGNRISVASDTGITMEGGSDSHVGNNRIITSVDNSTTASTAGGVILFWKSSTFPCQRNRVVNNFILGFVQGVRDDCWGDNASYNLIEDNGVAVITHKGDSGYFGVINNNRSPSVPATASTITLV